MRHIASANTVLEHKPDLTKKGVIVVVDDDPAILDALKMMLEFDNFQVETIADGSILPKIQKFKPQLILMDICLAETDGRDICRKLKTYKYMKDIPVIMISASVELENSIRDSGANDYLAKPFNMNQLLSKVNKYFSN